MAKGNRFVATEDNLVTSVNDKIVIEKLYQDVDFDENDVPSWLGNYIRWHHQVRSSDDEMKNAKFLVVDKEGWSFESNAKHIPYFVWMAAKHERIFLLNHWDLSSSSSICGIQDYVRPSILDWTLPYNNFIDNDAMDVVQYQKDHFHNNLIRDISISSNDNVKVLLVRGQDSDILSEIYRVMAHSNKNKLIFKYIFQSLFRVSGPIQQIVDNAGLDHNNNYMALHAHLPGEYYGKVLDDMEKKLQQVSEQALTQAEPFLGISDMPVYIGGDAIEHMKLWLSTKEEKQDNIVFLDDVFRPYINEQSCEGLYPAFVDLWMLSKANCIIISGNDDYSLLAAMLTGFDCGSMYDERSKYKYWPPFSHSPEHAVTQLSHNYANHLLLNAAATIPMNDLLVTS